MAIFGGGSTGGGLGIGIVYSLKDEFSNTADKISSKFNQMDGVTARASASIAKSLNNIKMGMAAMAVGAVMLAPLGAAVSKSMEFNAVISEVGAKANATGKELKMLSDDALRLGEATKFSAKQAAEGQSFLAMAGFDVNSIMQAMPGMLNLAAAGNMELARTADIASNILTQFTLEASEMGRVSDIMANAATSSNTNIEQLGEAMKYLGPTAAAFGISIEESTASIMALSNAGLQGSIGTRALGTSLANLARPTTQMSDAMAELGLNFFNSQGKFVGINKMVGMLEKSFTGMTDKQRMYYMTTIFGAQSMQELNSLMTAQTKVMRDGEEVTLNGAAALEELTKQNMNAAGTAERMAKQMMDNLKGDITILKSVFETALIKIGQTVEPVLRPIVQFLSKIVAGIGKLAQSKLGGFLIKLTAAVGALLVGFGGLVTVMNLAKFAAGKAAIAFQAMGKAQIAAAFASKGLAGGLKAVGRAAIKALIPLWPIILIGAAIAGVVWLIRKSLKSFDEVLQGTAAPAKGFLGFLQKLGGVLRGIGEIWKSANSEGFTMSVQLRDALDKLGILQLVINIGTWIVRVKEFFRGMGEGFKMVWTQIMKPIFKALGQAWNWLLDLMEKIGLNVRKNTSDVSKWAKAGKIVAMVIMAILVPAFISLAISVIMATWPILLIIAVIAAVIWAIKNWAKIVEWFKMIWGKVWDWIKDKAMGFWDGIKNMGARIKNWGASIVQKLKEGIQSAWGNFKSWLAGLWEKLMAPIKGVLKFLGLGKAEGEVNINENVRTAAEGQMDSPIGNAVAQVQAAAVEQNIPTIIDKSTQTETVKNINLNIDGRPLNAEIQEIETEENFRE